MIDANAENIKEFLKNSIRTISGESSSLLCSSGFFKSHLALRLARLPDPTKATEDLKKFVKANEKQLYKLLRILMDPQTDLKLLLKSHVRPFPCPLSGSLADASSATRRKKPSAASSKSPPRSSTPSSASSATVPTSSSTAPPSRPSSNASKPALDPMESPPLGRRLGSSISSQSRGRRCTRLMWPS